MKRADDIFFTTLSVVMLLIVVIGFAPSYFLRGAVFAPLPSVLVHLHGAVFSTWILLFVVQSSLVAAGNLRLHRKLGWFGAVIAGLMVVLGVLAIRGVMRRGAVLPNGFTPQTFVVDNLIAIAIFGLLVALAVAKRNNRKLHKRLMLIANAMLLPPALSRIPFMAAHPPLIGLIPIALMLALVVFDIATWRKPLLVSILGALLLVTAKPLMDAAAHSSAGAKVTVWAQGHP